MMTDSQKSFVKVKLWFSKLVNRSYSEQNEQIKQLLLNGTLKDEQVKILKDMLQADGETELATGISSKVISEAGHDIQIIDQQIGPYKIIKPLGEGGMGQVYLAQRNDGTFEHQVALKLPHFNFNPAMKLRFENERQILAQLTHYNIAHLLDGGTTANNQPYLVMEYIQGRNIDDYCIDKIPSLNERLQLILQICAAVTFSHQQLVLHRDLKPSNILVTDDGQVKLLDFGIAKLLDLDEEAKAKNTATQIMTRYYASPEQLQGKPASTHSDLFSLAIIAYELITGYHPFQHETQHEREQNLISGKIMRVTQRTDDNEAIFPQLAKIPSGKLQGDLENILLKALSVDPDKRYDSVKEFTNDLNSFIDNKPVTARKLSLTYTSKKWIQRNKAFTILAIFTIFSLITATIYSINTANHALIQQNIAIIEKDKAEGIADFMKNIFNNAVPEIATKELTAKDILLQALVDIDEKEFKHQESKFELLSLIHENLITIGKFQESSDRIDQHYQDCIEALNESEFYCQQMLVVKFKIFAKKRDYVNSMAVLKKMETIAYKKSPPDNDELFQIYLDIKNVARNMRDKEVYKEYIFKALDIALFSPDPNFRHLTDIYQSMASYYIYHYKFEEAKEALDKLPKLIKLYPHEENILKQKSIYSLWANLYASKKTIKLGYQKRKKIMELYHDNYSLMPQSYGWDALLTALTARRAGEPGEAIKLLNIASEFYTNEVDDNDIMLFRIGLHKIDLSIMTNELENVQLEFKKISELLKNNSKVIKMYEDEYQIVKFFVEMQWQPIEDSDKQIKELYEQLEPSFENSNKLHMILNILKSQLMIKKQNFYELEKLVIKLEELSKMHPEDNFSIKKQVIKLRVQLDAHNNSKEKIDLSE